MFAATATRRLATVLPIVFFTILFFVLFLLINPARTCFLQQPLFLLDTRFFCGFTARPGGLCEYLSLFFSQFFCIRVVGAVIITALFSSVYYITGKIIDQLSGHRFPVLQYLPVAALLYLHGSSNRTLVPVLSLFTVLISFYGYLRSSVKVLPVRVAGFLLWSTMVFYITGGGGFLLFQMLCLATVLVRLRKTALPDLAIMFLSFGLPYAANRFLFHGTFELAYLRLLIPDGYYHPKPVLYLLFLYYPLVVVALAFLTERKQNSYGSERVTLIAAVIQIVIVVGVTVPAAVLPLHAEEQFTAQIKYLAYQGRWEELLRNTRGHRSTDRLVHFNRYRALYHTGRLPDDLFRELNVWGQHALFLGAHAGGSVLMENSELYFEMGHIRAARQWAYEAQTIFEYSPRVLRMLTLTNIIEGNYQAAAITARLLEKSIMQRFWVRKYLRGLRDTTVFTGDQPVREMRARMPTEIFFMDGKNPQKELRALLEKNPNNRMAFEYLMAYLLLADRTDEFDLTDEIAWLRRLGYPEMPQTYQEALLVHLSRKGLAWENPGGYAINPVNVNGYADYMNILRDHRMNPRSAAKILYEKYACSYWYYLTYIYPLVNRQASGERKPVP
ncbi:MAG: hypothetical protein JW863_07895 [Chitinispirillaceae bacterium]|nr:hypothetical protein [Chitinispirillaceae bacterium]